MIFNVVVVVVVIVPETMGKNFKFLIKKFFKKMVKQIEFTFSTNSTEKKKKE